MMMSLGEDGLLDELGRKYGTDKSSAHHGYLDHYERYLGGWRERRLKLLEIGVHKGASLRMWREYFPRGFIVGLDIVPGCASEAGDRIAIVIGNQLDTAALDRALEYGPFDVIVDDGGHYVDEQLFSFGYLFPHLQPGGLYLLEDIYDIRVAQTLGTMGIATVTHPRARSPEYRETDIAAVMFYPGAAIIRHS